MLRAKRMTPPNPNSRASDRSSIGIAWPSKPATRSCPTCRRSAAGIEAARLYNPSVRIVSSAPTRIDLAGGTIDIWPLYVFHDGATTVNAAISLRAHVEIEPRTDGRLELVSIDTNRRIHADRWTDLDGSSELPLLALLARHYRL